MDNVVIVIIRSPATTTSHEYFQNKDSKSNSLNRPLESVELFRHQPVCACGVVAAAIESVFAVLCVRLTKS